MNEEQVVGTFLVVIFVLATSVFGMMTGDTVAVRHERKLAVADGVGKYVTNPKTGETRFFYGQFTQEVQP